MNNEFGEKLAEVLERRMHEFRMTQRAFNEPRTPAEQTVHVVRDAIREVLATEPAVPAAMFDAVMAAPPADRTGNATAEDYDTPAVARQGEAVTAHSLKDEAALWKAEWEQISETARVLEASVRELEADNGLLKLGAKQDQTLLRMHREERDSLRTRLAAAEADAGRYREMLDRIITARGFVKDGMNGARGNLSALIDGIDAAIARSVPK